MFKHILRASLLLALAVFSLQAHAQTLPLPRYSIIDLGVPGGFDTTSVSALNNNGVIAGVLLDPSSSEIKLFIYQKNAFQIVNVPGFRIDPLSCYLNDWDEIVVSAYKGDESHSFLRAANGNIQDINPSVYTKVKSINSNGDILGTFYPPYTIFTYNDGQFRSHDIRFSGYEEIIPNAINDKGQIACTAWHNSVFAHAFIANPDGTIIDVGNLSQYSSQPVALNNNAELLITCRKQLKNGTWANSDYLYSNGNLNDLGELENFPVKQGFGLNDLGYVVGVSASESGQFQKAFISHDGEIFELSKLIENLGQWDQLFPKAINNKGEIAGSGLFPSADGKGTEVHIFLLKPVD